MSKKKLAGIIASCAIVIVVAILLIHFEPWVGTPPVETYTLTTIVSPPEAGSVSPSGGEYESGLNVTLTASPASGYIFDYWSGAASGNLSSVAITMNSDKSIAANFKTTTQTYTLATNINPSGAGSVSPSSGQYESGAMVVLTANPASGYTFDYWSGNASGTVPGIIVTMDSGKNVTANFRNGTAMYTFITITKGELSGFDQPSSEVIRDQTTWEDTWDTIMSSRLDPPRAPLVDFTKYILLAHFMGQKSSTGYHVEFSQVVEGDDNIAATVREISPGPDCLVGAMMTAPYQVIQIPKTDKYVQFTVEKETYHCQN